MCGIAGQARCDGRPADRGLVEAMCDAIRHRGPDYRGIYCDEIAGLGIQRLRVIDLSTGDQPIFNEDRSVVVVLNGEIYNFVELRRRLEAAGHRFRTRSDTEVIVHLYEDLGPECVDQLDGMFAFALWDVGEQRLILARDRIGKKPLLYSEHDRGITFASEMSALVQDPEISRDLNLGAIDGYLALQYVPSPISVFESVRKLPPASVLTWQGGKTEIRRYWSVDRSVRSEQLSDRDLDERIRLEISDAVRRRLVSDVPLGAFLSGGIDSGAVVAAMAQNSSGPVKTFSIGFEDGDHSELPLARLVAERYSTEHHEFILKPDALAVIPSIVRRYGEPFADTSSVPSFIISRIAAGEVTVALNGDGGDESFAGYHRYIAQERLARFDGLPGPLRSAIAVAGNLGRSTGRDDGLIRRGSRFASLLGMSHIRRHEQLMSCFNRADRDDLYTDHFKEAVGESSVPRVFTEAWERTSGADLDLTGRLLAVDFETYLPGDLCAKIDIATMAYSLEARSPLLDHRLIEFAARIPSTQKIDQGQTKIALRRAVEPWLPQEVIAGPKRGFSIPAVGGWFKEDLRRSLNEIILDPRALDRGYFRPRSVRRLVDQNASGTADNGQKLWTLMMLELWHREFVDGPSSQATTCS